MGEIAEMMLDGTLCACCGEYLGDGDGYAVYCPSCAPDFEDAKPSRWDRPISKKKVRCPECGKGVKKSGLDNHLRDAHGISDSKDQCPACKKWVKKGGLKYHLQARPECAA